MEGQSGFLPLSLCRPMPDTCGFRLTVSPDSVTAYQKQTYEKTLAIALISLPGLFLCEAQAQWYKPYANGSADDHLIRFNDGPAGTVTAPDPSVGVGYTYNNTPAAGVESGWSLGASGSVGFGDGESFSAKSNAFTMAGGENLRFGADTEHRQDLLGASLPMTWSGSATIPAAIRGSWLATSFATTSISRWIINWLMNSRRSSMVLR